MQLFQTPALFSYSVYCTMQVFCDCASVITKLVYVVSHNYNYNAGNVFSYIEHKTTCREREKNEKLNFVRYLAALLSQTLCIVLHPSLGLQQLSETLPTLQ